MASNLLNKYVWLVETIYRAGYISYKEINAKWINDEISEGVGLPLRTFHKWRVAVEEMFGLVIDCKRKGGYRYYIANAEDLKEGNIRNWLLNTISTSNLLIDNLMLKDRILLEHIPSGQEFLTDIIDAMKKGSIITITYQNYWHNTSHVFDVEPYCVKLFKQRWYVIGRTPYYDQVRIYSLDRINEISLTNKKFQMPKSFNPTEYFEDSFGIIVATDTPAEKVTIKVSSTQAKYIRAVPLHHSQEEIESHEDFSIFEYWIRPTSDFLQELLWHGENIEVLKPQWFRHQIAEKIENLRDNYWRYQLFGE